MNPTELHGFATAIRRLAVELTYRTRTSHLGGALSQADLLAVLYSGVLRNTPETARRPDRDRLILSKGHCCASLYAALALRGFLDRQELLEHYCENGSRYFEHVSHLLPGVEWSTGSLGHGLPVACGLALGAKLRALPFDVFCLVGDGEMDEGSNWEALLFAAQHRLDNLCLVIDRNQMQALGENKDILDLSPLTDKLRDFQWHATEIDGHDFGQITDAFQAFREQQGRPTAIVANTVKGKGVRFMEHQLKFHYSPPNDAEYAQAMEELK
jgi:transketolase